MFSKKIAVIGSGAAGLTATYLLDPIHDVTLFEKAPRLGGHTHTHFLPDGPDAGTPVDTGFIVFNQKNYPLLCRLFERLDVQTEPSDMAFGLTCRQTGLEYCSDFPHGLFAWKRNLLRPDFLTLIADVLRLNQQAKKDLNSDWIYGKTLGQWLQIRKVGKAFQNFYLLPMGAAIWSTPTAQMLDFPAEMFLRFFENHGLWDLKNRPQWRFVSGGSQSYVQKIKDSFRGKMNIDAGGVRVCRLEDGVQLKTQGATEKFDAVVIAAHADEALNMLEDPSDEEKSVLGAWKYTPNQAVLHWDETLMPSRKRAWASWNYHIFSENFTQLKRVKIQQAPVALTYWMNRLQNLKTSRPYFVTLNATAQIDPKKIIRVIDYTHPHYTFDSIASQKCLPVLNGKRNTYFCGSYFGNGFHEDAVRSAVRVAEMFGAEL